MQSVKRNFKEVLCRDVKQDIPIQQQKLSKINKQKNIESMLHVLEVDTMLHSLSELTSELHCK